MVLKRGYVLYMWVFFKIFERYGNGLIYRVNIVDGSFGWNGFLLYIIIMLISEL